MAGASALASGAQEPPITIKDAGQAADRASASPPPASLPQMAPPRAPKVTCPSDQLAISADNSTLEAVLAAVHACTGVPVDMPAGAAASRVFGDLGPGPARQVLESLLNGTEFNYVIGSSDTDPQKISSVVLLLRGTDAPTSLAGVVGGHALTPARRAWVESRQNRMAGAPSGGEGNPAAEEASDAPPGEDAGNSIADTSKASASQAPASDASPPAAEAPAAPADSGAAPVPPTAAPALASDARSNSSQGQGGTEERISDMQQMFQQRRQMNQNQSQGSTTSPQP